MKNSQSFSVIYYLHPHYNKTEQSREMTSLYTVGVTEVNNGQFQSYLLFRLGKFRDRTVYGNDKLVPGGGENMFVSSMYTEFHFLTWTAL